METEDQCNIDKQLEEVLINISNEVIIRDYADIIKHKSIMNISLKDYARYYHNNFSNKEIDRRVLLIV